MKTSVASRVKKIVNWVSPLFLLGGLLYLVYDDYRDNGTATEEQLLMISHEIPCAGEAFRTALRNSPEPLTLRAANKIAAKCNEKDKQLQALNNIAPGK
ncbi:TPA: hypothetical protein QHW61_005252 [Klebsiella oxytoca]|nr:hypothetical protein [Klebsiella oxytoca]